MAERGRTWSNRETAVLLAKWSDKTIQRQLRGAVRNVVPFRVIADELRRQGFELNFKQCREKIKVVKKHYKETVDSLRRSGVGVESEDDLEDVHIKFRWFGEMHGVMGRRAAVNPPSLLDTSDLHRQRSSTADTAEDSLPMTRSVDLPGPSVASVKQLGEGEGIGEQSQQPGANSVDQPGARKSTEEQPGLGTSTVEQPGAREHTGEQPGLRTSSVEQPGAREHTGEQPGLRTSSVEQPGAREQVVGGI